MSEIRKIATIKSTEAPLTAEIEKKSNERPGSVIDELREEIAQVQSDVDLLEENKQDTLVSGVNIKTINEESILGEGNISIDFENDVVVRKYTRETISNVSFTIPEDDYNALMNAPSAIIVLAVTQMDAQLVFIPEIYNADSSEKVFKYSQNNSGIIYNYRLYLARISSEPRITIQTSQTPYVSTLNGYQGAVTLKTINNKYLTGNGNIEINTYETIPSSWSKNSTTVALCQSIVNDSTAVKGKGYLGQIYCSDLPGGLVQGEVVIEVIDSGGANGKLIRLSMSSLDTHPYRWEYNYGMLNGSYTSTGWVGYQPELVSGTNIKTVNGQSLLGSGDISEDQMTVVDVGANVDVVLSSAQIKLMKENKLILFSVVYYYLLRTIENGIYYFYSSNFGTCSTGFVEAGSNDGLWLSVNPTTGVVSKVNERLVNISTVLADGSNFFDTGAIQTNGKRIIREKNIAGKLLPSISGSTDANKIVNVNSSYTGYELNDVKTINSQSIIGTGDIDTSETVEITSLGVQSDEMAAKIETAKYLYYNNFIYTRYGTTTVQVDTNPGTANVTAYVFRKPLSVGSSMDYTQGLTYIPYNKTVKGSPDTGTARVSGIGPMFGSAYGHINLDSSLKVSKSGTDATMSLTGNVPYATTEPESDNVNGFMKMVVLDHEPAEEDRHEGYMYLVTGSGGADVNSLYVSSTTISSGDNLNTVEPDLLDAMLAHRPVEFNDVRCSFQADDGTNVQYSNMTLNGIYLHVNIIVVAQSTGIVTFNTFNIGDTATAIGGSY